MNTITTSNAILSLVPGAEFVLRGDVLEWYSSDLTEPTKQQIKDEVARLEAEQPWNELRQERNRRLSETDWEIVKHKELGTNIPAALKTYRQDLRDLPANTTDVANPVWPTKPGAES
jgi:hypothetical protein|tara:strand:+ start:1456 stop:1806 length:351 start_codon:yes stop_codon:yes gene_type:complete